MRALSIVLAFVGVLAFGSEASAGFIGNTVEYRYLFPDLATTFEGPTNAVVGPGPEFFVLTTATADLTDTTITLDWSSYTGSTFTAGGFNGTSFFDVFFTIDPIVNVTLNPATTFLTFDAGRISFDANTVRLNFESLFINAGQSLVVLDVTFNQVPEPASLTLLGIGAAGMVGAWRKRKASK